MVKKSKLLIILILALLLLLFLLTPPVVSADELTDKAKSISEQENYYYRFAGKFGSDTFEISLSNNDSGITIYLTREKKQGFFERKRYRVNINDYKKTEIGTIDRVSLSYKNSIEDEKVSSESVLSSVEAQSEIFKKLYLLTLNYAINQKIIADRSDLKVLDNLFNEVFENYNPK